MRSVTPIAYGNCYSDSDRSILRNVRKTWRMPLVCLFKRKEGKCPVSSAAEMELSCKVAAGKLDVCLRSTGCSVREIGHGLMACRC